MIPESAGIPSGRLFLVESAAARRRRLAQIQQRLHEGEYEVAATTVADAIMAFFSRDIDPCDWHNPGISAESC